MSNSRSDYQSYWIYFFAVMFSLIGINLFIYSQGWYVLDISGSKLSVGLSWSLFFTPGLFLLPVVGKLLDSEGAKKVLLFFEFGRAAVLFTFIPVLYLVPTVHMVYIMSAIFGLFFCTFYQETAFFSFKLFNSARERA
jgi:MFS family permease